MKFKVADVMTTHVISVRSNTPIDEIFSLLLRHNISGVPVTDHEGQLQGVISERDLLHMMVTPEEEVLTVADLWSTDVISVMQETDLPDVADLFLRRNIRRIPVVDQENRLVGIVSRRDILRRICEIRIKIDAELNALKSAKKGNEQTVANH